MDDSKSAKLAHLIKLKDYALEWLRRNTRDVYKLETDKLEVELLFHALGRVDKMIAQLEETA